MGGSLALVGEYRVLRNEILSLASLTRVLGLELNPTDLTAQVSDSYR